MNKIPHNILLIPCSMHIAPKAKQDCPFIHLTKFKVIYKSTFGSMVVECDF